MPWPADIARSLIDALDEPAMILQGERTLAANAAAKAALGRQIEGRDVRLALRHPDALRAVLSKATADLELVGLGAADRPWLLSLRPLGTDMTLVRLIDRSAARAAEKMRVDFVANASHELRTPLATIAGYAETLAEEGDIGSESRRSFAATILGEAKRMLRIVEDLMSLSRIEAERFVVPRDPVDLAELAQLAADQARPLAERQQCSVQVVLEEPLPRVPGDFAQLLQAVDNLVTNAIRYGCVVSGCEVRIEARRDGDRALLCVRDTGEGIEPQHLPRVTERFYRVDPARSRDSGGTGLGLAIVKHIVERHRGTLDIRSRPGQGTAVELRLPLS